MHIQAGKLLIRLNEAGEIVEWQDADSGRELRSGKRGLPFIRAAVAGKTELPTSMSYAEEVDTLTFVFAECGARIDIAVTIRDRYAAFRVSGIAGEEPDAIIWGPYMSSLSGSIGESVGVVHDGQFACGIQALNAKTIGGWPVELDRLEGVQDTYSGSDAGMPDPDSRKPSDNKFKYEVCAAWPTGDGSMLQAYARNRTRAARRKVWNLPDIPVAPIEGEDAFIAGTGIALFGSRFVDVLHTIEDIELGEGLPHPMIEGVWGKTSPAANQSYLITDFTEQTISDAVRYARMANLSYVYHPDPFSEWGHFTLKPGSFPNGDEGLRACVDYAAGEGVKVGVHTLSNFTTLNDPYVTPKPSRDLQTVGSASLVADVHETSDEWEVDDPGPFTVALFRRSARIGDEIIEYAGVSESAPWKLLGVKRGANGTMVSAHQAGLAIERLWDHPYDVFFPNHQLQDRYSDRIAGLFAKTGLKQISFDGLEGVYATGQDGYGVNRFVQRCHEGWGDEVINDASIVVPNYLWHIFTRFNWGEPWGAATREGQLEWRLSNQRYFQRNFIPPMLGWFLIRAHSERFQATQLDEIEWVLSKAAGFGAGFALVADLAVWKRIGNGEALLRAVREWELARHANAFTQEQRERLQDPRGDWHLEAVSEGTWKLYPVHYSQPLECDPQELQPGQPGGADWAYFNPYDSQSLAFCLRVNASYGNDDASILRPTFYTNGAYMTFDTEVGANQYLVCDGDRTGRIYDLNWNLLSEVRADADVPTLRGGGQTLSFSCKFTGDPKPVVSVRVSVKGRAELVQAKVTT
ncbi:hypothetical protein M6D81_10495 [Paenibacillus sp. J5C_2022]|uniref:hypothetical protein n=1 Tax=Paenibacillus sp. J5C2022 TaxID=2977129 RepID=UPI0021D20A7D|nr:hypothetical protein [Paenibacillus sp. J5C2022]MCU6709140.1 hypothetical protein [Paenibacillus sp. J5C2022]